MDYHGSHNANLTPTGLADKLIHEIIFLANILLDRDLQKIIKEKYRDIILEHRSAISDTTNLLPLEAALVVILATEHKNINHEINDLYKYIDKRLKESNERMGELEGEIEVLKKRLNDKK